MNMKRWIAGILIILLLPVMAGCSYPADPQDDSTLDTTDAALQQTDPSNGTQTNPTDNDVTQPDPSQTEPTGPEPIQAVKDYFSNIIGTRWRISGDTPITLWVNPMASLETVKALQPGDEVELLGWSYYFAKVSCDGKVGYVLSKYIEPIDSDKQYYSDALNTVEYAELYTYEMMMEDLNELAQRYPNAVQLESIGTTTWGTSIPVVRIGSEDAQYHILIQAAIHGCEYITTWVVMAMVDYWIDYAMADNPDVCYHVIPMTNPDGVYTSQTGTLSDEQYQIYLSDRAKGYTYDTVEWYAQNWKANASGVDLNRNFPSGWETITERMEPSNRKYRGTAPFSAPEALALKEYTLSYDFDVTLSYHTAGSVLYYDYGDNPVTNSAAKSLALAVNAVNGYILLGADTVDGAGYKDWVEYELGIPSLTIELGYVHPVEPALEYYTIFATECNMMATVADWVRTYNN